MWKGIDVSDNQGRIDWKKVKEAGCQFAVLRSVRRSGRPDRQFGANVSGCRENGIPFEVYKYTYAAVPSQAVEEAEQVAGLLAEYGLSCRVWWDVEDRSLKGLGEGVLTGLIRSAQNTLEGEGLEFGVYTGLDFYESGFFRASAIDCPYWIARYPSSAYYEFGQEPPAETFRPKIGEELAAWQYTGKGRIGGIEGNVDLDVCYAPFRETGETGREEGTIWCFSIADVWTEALARTAAAVYPACKVHRAEILDAGGIEIWVVSAADVWTRAQAEEAGRRFGALGIAGVVHNIRVLA